MNVSFTFGELVEKEDNECLTKSAYGSQKKNGIEIGIIFTHYKTELSTTHKVGLFFVVVSVSPDL